MVSASTLIGPFEFDRALATRPLLTCDRAVNNGRVASARSNSNGPIRVEAETILRVSVVASPVTKHFHDFFKTTFFLSVVKKTGTWFF